jgi:hypothetical protein
MNAHGAPHTSNADVPTSSIRRFNCDDKQSNFPIVFLRLLTEPQEDHPNLILDEHERVAIQTNCVFENTCGRLASQQADTGIAIVPNFCARPLPPAAIGAMIPNG